MANNKKTSRKRLSALLKDPENDIKSVDDKMPTKLLEILSLR
jgi:hypothetical protein